MKLIITLSLIVYSFFGYSQSTFPEGTYVSNLDDIIIRNDSVITHNVSYYVFYWVRNENKVNGVITLSYTNKEKDKTLIIYHKHHIPKHLIFRDGEDVVESFNVAFTPK